IVKDIRRATRKQYSAEEKIRIVLDGLRGEHSIAELCRREGIAESLYYTWSKEFLEAGKRRLAGDTARAATSGEVKDLRREASALKEVVAEPTLENRLVKKHGIGEGGGAAWDPPHPRKPRLSGWSGNRPCRSNAHWRNSPSRGPRSIAGAMSIKAAGQRPWTIARPGRIASGTAFRTISASGSCSWPWTSPPC